MRSPTPLHRRGGFSSPTLAVVAGLVAAVACGAATAADTAEAPPDSAARGIDESAAQRLVRRLGSGSVSQRDAAARGLVDLGPNVLPLVTAARRHAGGESARRLSDIERLLLQRAANDALDPALVTLAADNLPANDVLRRIFAQAGSRIEVSATADRPISWRCDRLTFWEAIDEVLDRSGLALQFTPLAVRGPESVVPQLRIVDAEPGTPPPAVAAGPVRVSIAGIERTGPSAGGTDDEGRSRGARVTLRVAWEPRLEPLVVRLPARSLVADGPAGEAMPVAQRTAVVEATIAPRRPWVDLPVLFAAPAVPLDRLAMLRGTIVLWLKGMEHTFRFDGIQADRGPSASAVTMPLRIGQAEVRLQGARLQGDRLHVRAAVTYDAASEALSSHHSWLTARRLEASITDGPRLEQVDQRVESRTDRGISVAAEFIMPPVGPTGRRELGIRWTLPIAIHEQPIDFALRDVPLPAPPAR